MFKERNNFAGMSRISILTPFKNAEKFIRETAESILKQTHQDWEWILVNDHSSENEVGELAEILNDPRIRLVENSGNGIVDALCTALSIASGKYVTRMDADDLMPVFKLEKMLQFFENHPAQIVTGKVCYFSGSDLISDGYLNYETWLNDRVDKQDFLKHIYRECTIASGNWLMLRSDLAQCGGFRNLIYPEDYDLLFRWYQHDYKIAGIDVISHLWRDHENRTSKTSDNYHQKAFFQLKTDRFIELDLDRSKLVVLNGTGQKGRLTAKRFIEKNVEFIWISHEAEKFSKGILNHKILGLDQLPFAEQAQILNTTLIDNDKLKEFYDKSISEMTFYML